MGQSKSLLKNRKANSGVLLGLADGIGTHIGDEDFRDGNCTIFILIIFQNSGNCASYSHTAAVECVRELRLFFGIVAETDSGAACLVQLPAHPVAIRSHRGAGCTAESHYHATHVVIHIR